MRILVTGGCGFIGSHLVDRLVKEGYQVRILDSLDPKIHRNGAAAKIHRDVEFVHGDVTDRAALRNALRDVDFVSHQAAYQDYMPDFSRFLHVNATSTALIYELIVAERLPIRKVIVASSQAVYGEGQYSCAAHGSFLPTPRTQEQLRTQEWEVRCPRCRCVANPTLLAEEHANPFNQYAVSKLAQEKTAIGLGWLNGIPTVALRYSITQGARQSLYNQYSGICRIFVGRALRNLPLTIYEDGLQTRDFVHIDDVVAANMLVLQNESADFNAFNVGSGNAVSVLDYAKAVCAKVSPNAGWVKGGQYRRGDNRHSVSSIDKLSKLGWAPKRDLSYILDDFVAWVDQIGGIPQQVIDGHAEMERAGVLISTVPD